jgi:hypothetical protein
VSSAVEGVAVVDGKSAAGELARFRGGFARAPLTARRLAGLLDSPGCARREVVDAAGVPMDDLAGLLGSPPGRQSPFTHARNGRFEARCLTGHPTPLADLAARHLALPTPTTRTHDLGTTTPAATRATSTRNLLTTLFTPPHTPTATDPAPTDALPTGSTAATSEVLASALVVIRGAVVELVVAGEPALVELDTLVLAGTPDRWHPVAIRSFPAVDGTADPVRVAQVARVLAVTVLALRSALTRLDPPDELDQPDQPSGPGSSTSSRISTRALLALPENFALAPTGAVLDLAPQVRRLSRALATLAAPDHLTAALSGVPALPDPAGSAAGDGAVGMARQALGALPSRFGDGCPRCGLFAYCRDEQEAGDQVARLGSAAANLCGGTATVTDALALAQGDGPATGPAEQALATALARAARALDLAAAPR